MENETKGQSGSDCRSEFIVKWVDDQAKYFPRVLPTPRLINRLASYTYGPSPMYYFYSEPIPVPHPPRDIQLPHIIPAPHRISPMIPVYK